MLHLKLSECSITLLRAIADECKNKEDIQKVLEFKEKAVYKIVAGNPHASEDTLRYLYEEYGESVVWSLAENEATPRDVLHEIAISASEEVARVLFSNSKLEADDIDYLLEKYKEDTFFVEEAIRHENVSSKTLIKIVSWHIDYAKDVLSTGKVKLVES